MTQVLYVAFGGAIGATIRFLISKLFSSSKILNNLPEYFNYISFINILGSFLIGILVGYFTKESGSNINENFKLMLTVGVLGGFTTFSAFSLDFLYLIQKGAIANAIIYVIASIFFSFLAVFLGFYLLSAK